MGHESFAARPDIGRRYLGDPPSWALGMMMLEFLRHSVPFQTQPSGQTGGGPGSVTGQTSPPAAAPSGEAVGAVPSGEAVGEDAPPQAKAIVAPSTTRKRIDNRRMISPRWVSLLIATGGTRHVPSRGRPRRARASYGNFHTISNICADSCFSRQPLPPAGRTGQPDPPGTAMRVRHTGGTPARRAMTSPARGDA